MHDHQPHIHLTIQHLDSPTVLDRLSALSHQIEQIGVRIMSRADDLNAKLDSTNARLDVIQSSVANLSEDVSALKQLVADSTNPDGISPTDAATILTKLTDLEAKATALATQAATAADQFPTPPTV
jgi:hypothetical protein